MSTHFPITTSRIEAFSDGVIAIIITVMVFDLKITEAISEDDFWKAIVNLLPKLLSYVVSFLVLAILWVNHHQLFHQIKHSDGALLWYNLHLLFWMSLIPFATSLIGANPGLWHATAFYSLIFLFNSWAFALLRKYVNRKELLHESISLEAQRKILRKNRLALGMYLGAALLSPISIYPSFVLLLLVPAMYFIPEKITTKNTNP
ncbi:DUF1211 domain-containing protein [Algoriphagus lacus]|uniref:DUF1211 domain-containing protein n=1 Tax=Algoriphagus lacus TaxID=2056311 RepID=A0A418PRZ3_9BACT|nr:TMEM175 family protein [Algoriphagus lacus]RIW15641.1 DUF1211 domain-containing protein [Algoriphagus lacus]